jgi:hypothetical protein
MDDSSDHWEIELGEISCKERYAKENLEKFYTSIHEEFLWVDREEEWRRLCHKVTHCIRNVNG